MDYEQRLVDIVNFLRWIIISANGYLVKELITKMACGDIDLKEAVTIWYRSGESLFHPYAELMEWISKHES